MSLSDCPECSHKVARSAVSCPQCGNTIFTIKTDIKILRVCNSWCKGGWLRDKGEDCPQCKGTGVSSGEYLYIDVRDEIDINELKNRIEGENKEMIGRMEEVKWRAKYNIK